MTMTRASVGILVLAIGLSGCSGNNSKNSPTGPSGSGGGAAGAWTGTLTRPGGQAPMSVRWQASVQGESDLTGPMTLTNGGASVTVTAKGSTAGNDRSGYTIHLMLSSNTGDIAGFPDCTVRANTAGSGTGDPFRQPYTSISVPALDISYSGCAGFVEYPPQRNFVQETVGLSLTKP
jgi:hypothetical protein